MMDAIQKKLLEQVADLHDVPQGAYSLRINGTLYGKNDSENITIEKKNGMDDDEVMMVALEAGAEDFSAEDDEYEILTAPDDFAAVCDGMREEGYEFTSSQINRIPSMTVSLEDAACEKFMKMLDMFDDNDDVQNVYHNAELPEDEEEDD